VAAYCKHGNGTVSVSESTFVEDLGKYSLAESLPLKVVYLYTYVHYSAYRSGCKLLLTDRTLCICMCVCVCVCVCVRARRRKTTDTILLNLIMT
jgi:hypothetical protein